MVGEEHQESVLKSHLVFDLEVPHFVPIEAGSRLMVELQHQKLFLVEALPIFFLRTFFHSHLRSDLGGPAEPELIRGLEHKYFS